MKENWTYKPFMECIEKVKYTTKIQSKDFAEVGKYPIISQEDTYISGYWDNEADVFRTIRPLVIFGDHTRVLKYIDFDFVLGADGVKILLPIQEIMAKFMYYYIQWYKIPNLGYSRHFKLFQDIKFPMAPMSTQQSIVRELGTINEVLSKKREQLKEYDTLAQSIFYDMFGDPVTNEKGWEVKKLGEISTFRRGSFPQPYGNPEWYGGDGDMPFVQVADLFEDCFDLVSKTKNSISKIAQPMSVFVPSGTVLVSLQGTIGKVAITQYDSYVDRTLAIFREINTHCLSKIVFAYLLKYIFAEKKKKARGISIKTITKEEFTAFDCPLPPLPLQQTFAEKIEKIEQMKENLKASIKETETLLESRMSYWFE